jgi:hypothetical protein
MSPKPTAQRRRDRRALLDNLLARMLRGRLTPAEAALLAETVREEQRAYDQTRRSLAETGTAYGKHRAAADAAIREAEQRAEKAEEHLAAVRAQLSESETLGHRLLKRAEEAEAVTAHTKALLDRRTTTLRRRAEQAEAALARVRQADTLGAALAAVAQFDGLTPQAAAVQAAITDRADTVEARLAEQAREYEVALATARRTAREAEAAASRSEGAAEDHRGAMSFALGLGYGASWAVIHERARKLRDADESAREGWEEAAQQRARANGWRAHAIETDDRADRHLAAWRSARARAAKRTAQLNTARQERSEAFRHADAARQRAEHAEQALATTRQELEQALETAAVRGEALAAHLRTDSTAGLTATQAADNLRQWGAAGIPADQFARPRSPGKSQ